MENIQLYYPSLNPDITPQIAISLLHWDKIIRIFPKEKLDSRVYQSSINSDLEPEGILGSEQLEYEDIEKCITLFDRIVSISSSSSSKQLASELLIQPFNNKSRYLYFIFRGKSNADRNYSGIFM